MQCWRKKNPKSHDKPYIWSRNAKIVSDRGAMLLEDLIECCDGKSNPIKFFSAYEIRKAANDFNESNYVSELSNSDYKWYSGKNENHHMLLIKKAVRSFSRDREGTFCRDIAISSMVSGHKNFLKLVGCCLEFIGPIMVYHDVKKHYKLDDISEQPWKKRMKIAEDIATALAYLHTAFPRPFIYRTISLGKILLDDDGVAKLSDFSFCISIPEGETFVQVDRAVGLYSYMDDNYLRNGVVSEKTDVFAIGMLVQTLLTGKERFWEICVVEEANGEGCDDDDSYDSATMSEMNDPGRQFQFRLLQFKEEQRRDEIVDPKMLEKMGEISEEERCQMKAFRMLSLRCISRTGEVPTMVEVAKELKKIQRSLKNDSSSGEIQFDSAQDISSSVVVDHLVELAT